MTLRTAFELVGVGIAVVLGTAAEVERHRANAEHLQYLNAQAQADTTRHWYAGQLAVATRLVYQGQVDLGKALQQPHTTATAVATVVIHGDTSHATTATVPSMPTDSGDTVFSGTYQGQAERVTAEVVTRPKPPVIHWTVVRDPIAMSIALACGSDGSARATVTGPRWATFDLDSLRQAPEVCNPAPKWTLLSLKPPSLPWSVALVVGGYLLGRR